MLLWARGLVGLRLDAGGICCGDLGKACCSALFE